MRSRLLLYWASSLLLSSCMRSSSPQALGSSAHPVAARVVVDSLQLVDPTRQRRIPLVRYFPQPSSEPTQKLKVALLNHGYHGQNTDYAFLAANLVVHGYYVISIQHELPGDEPLAMSGNLYQARYPNWERGVQTIRFVLQDLAQRQPQLDWQHVLLMGHSNGGDMVMLLAQEHPELRQVQQLISFDNRRVPFPRRPYPQVLSLRSSDQLADVGVLPTPTEQTQFGITLVQLPATIHNDMWDGATEAQKQQMNAAVSHFLEKK
jgi:predicted dienelactone hydrolase